MPRSTIDRIGSGRNGDPRLSTLESILAAAGYVLTVIAWTRDDPRVPSHTYVQRRTPRYPDDYYAPALDGAR